MENRRSYFLIALLLCFYMGTIAFSSGRGSSSDGLSEKKYLAPPPEHLEYFAFGFNESMADSLWLRWIQDSDYCQTYLSPMEKLDNKVDIKADPLLLNPRNKICDNSWAFKMLDAVTRLAPKFLIAYLAGGIALSVMVEDYIGASAIFERGLQNYPDHWNLNYRAAYHYLYDRADIPRAAQLLMHAADTGGPVWLRSLASRLYDRLGQLQLGIATLEAYRKTIDNNPKALAEVDARLEKLRAQVRKGP